MQESEQASKTVQIELDELSSETQALLRRAREEGALVDITDHGELVARLIPAQDVNKEEHDRQWAELKQLGEEISKRWPAEVSAVEAVRDVRREL